VPGHVPDLNEIDTQVRRDRFATVSSACLGAHAEMPGGGSVITWCDCCPWSRRARSRRIDRPPQGRTTASMVRRAQQRHSAERPQRSPYQ
jgi:hypothetical protein